MAAEEKKDPVSKTPPAPDPRPAAEAPERKVPAIKIQKIPLEAKIPPYFA
jgi:hypothetical protein